MAVFAPKHMNICVFIIANVLSELNLIMLCFLYFLARKPYYALYVSYDVPSFKIDQSGICP